jgi:hypothetical protein
MTLSDSEVRVLRRVLAQYLPQLRRETAAAEQHDVKRDMWALEHALTRLVERLAVAEGDHTRA